MKKTLNYILFSLVAIVIFIFHINNFSYSISPLSNSNQNTTLDSNFHVNVSLTSDTLQKILKNITLKETNNDYYSIISNIITAIAAVAAGIGGTYFTGKSNRIIEENRV